MMKLTGKKLNAELKKRKSIKEERQNQHKTLRVRAKELNMDVIAYSAYENGYDIYPHKKYKKILGGIPPNFVIEICDKCGCVKTMKKLKFDFLSAGDSDLNEAFENLKHDKKH